MKVTGTFQGASVTIVGINNNGRDIYVNYIDGSGVLKSTRIWVAQGEDTSSLATSASSVD